MTRQKQRVHKDLQGLYEESPVGLCALDTNLRYIHINDWLAAINGLPVEAHLGRTIREVLPDMADLLVRAGLLGTELIARKPENRETARLVALVKCMQTCILGSEASLAREVDHQADLAREARQLHLLAGNRLHLEIVHARHR